MFFKKFILIFLSLLIIVLPSCGKGKLSADELGYKLLNLYPVLPPCSQYVKNAEEYSSCYISPEDFSFLYMGTKEKLPEWELIDEFRIILSNSTEFFEIHIIKTNNASDADEIAKLLSRRQRLLELFIKEEGDYTAKAAELVIRGKYVILLATDDNESAKILLKKLL